jgi:hypothetical protein
MCLSSIFNFEKFFEPPLTGSTIPDGFLCFTYFETPASLKRGLS